MIEGSNEVSSIAETYMRGLRASSIPWKDQLTIENLALHPAVDERVNDAKHGLHFITIKR